MEQQIHNHGCAGAGFRSKPYTNIQDIKISSGIREGMGYVKTQLPCVLFIVLTTTCFGQCGPSSGHNNVYRVKLYRVWALLYLQVDSWQLMRCYLGRYLGSCRAETIDVFTELVDTQVTMKQKNLLTRWSTKASLACLMFSLWVPRQAWEPEYIVHDKVQTLTWFTKLKAYDEACASP